MTHGMRAATIEVVFDRDEILERFRHLAPWIDRSEYIIVGRYRARHIGRSEYIYGRRR